MTVLLDCTRLRVTTTELTYTVQDASHDDGVKLS